MSESVSLLKALPRGFYPQLTGGLGSVEYLRHVRGECGPDDACEVAPRATPRRRPRSRFVCDETGCGQQARWYLTSGPMFVCWQHKLHYESEGEQTSPLSGGWA